MTRLHRSAALAAAVMLSGASLALAAPGAVAAPAASACGAGQTPPQTVTLPSTPQTAFTRLSFDRVWAITRGAGVRVAVLDSGYVPYRAGSYPNLAGMHVDTRRAKNLAAPGTPLVDCANHGIGVTALIGGQPADTTFSGVAPESTIIPIKVQQGDVDKATGAANVIAGITAAVDAGAKVVNLSVGVSAADSRLGQLYAAVRYARDRHVILVCASGNHEEGKPSVKTYPAAWSKEFDNVITVSAVDANDGVTNFSDTGDYVDVAAPGTDLFTVSSGGGYVLQSGTSFAAPLVTGTVALMLSHDSGLTPAQVKGQLEATADPPPFTVPNRYFGWGVINPYLAVTEPAVAGLPSGPTAHSAAALPPIPAIKPADRTLQHAALGVGAGLLGLAAMVAVGASVLRDGRRPAVRARR